MFKRTKHTHNKKHKPSYDLSEFKAAFNENRALTATSCRKKYVEMGFNDEMVKVAINKLQLADFRHSITSDHNHRVFQDVYDIKTELKGVEIDIYLKFVINEGQAYFTLLSFKER